MWSNHSRRGSKLTNLKMQTFWRKSLTIESFGHSPMLTCWRKSTGTDLSRICSTLTGPARTRTCELLSRTMTTTKNANSALRTSSTKKNVLESKKEKEPPRVDLSPKINERDSRCSRSNCYHCKKMMLLSCSWHTLSEHSTVTTFSLVRRIDLKRHSQRLSS